jgi:hypothetical protein
MSRSFVVNAFVMLLLVVAAATVIGLVSLWPDERTIPRPEGLGLPDTRGARVVGVQEIPCGPGSPTQCRLTLSGRDGPRPSASFRRR